MSAQENKTTNPSNRRRPRVIAVLSVAQTGKTIVAANLADALSFWTLPVLFIVPDLVSVNGRTNHPPFTLADVFRFAGHEIGTEVRESELGLGSVERPVWASPLAVAADFSEESADIPPPYGYIVIDGPSGFHAAAEWARRADDLLIVLTPEATHTTDLKKYVEGYRAQLAATGHRPREHFLLNRIAGLNSPDVLKPDDPYLVQTREELVRQYGDALLPTTIPYDPDLHVAATHLGRSIQEYRLTSVTARAFRELAEYFSSIGSARANTAPMENDRAEGGETNP